MRAATYRTACELQEEYIKRLESRASPDEADAHIVEDPHNVNESVKQDESMNISDLETVGDNNSETSDVLDIDYEEADVDMSSRHIPIEHFGKSRRHLLEIPHSSFSSDDVTVLTDGEDVDNSIAELESNVRRFLNMDLGVYQQEQNNENIY